MLKLFRNFGALGAIRTPDPQIRSLMLYPAELRALTASSAKARNLVASGRGIQARRLTASAHKPLQPSDEMIEHQRACGGSIFRSSCITTQTSRWKPNASAQDRGPGWDRAAAIGRLAGADAEAGAQGGQLRPGRCRCAGRTGRASPRRRVCSRAVARRLDAVVADQGVAGEVVHALRHAVLLQIAAVGDRSRSRTDADAPGGQRVLGRPGHAHGDVGVAAQQVLLPVGQHQLDGRPRGCCSRKSVRIGGRISAPTMSLAVTRITPRTPAASPEAVRTRASAAAAMAWAWGASASAASVGRRPPGQRVNRGVPPSACSSASMCRPTVGWAMPRLRAAPDRLPVSSTARKAAVQIPVGARVAHTSSYSRRTGLGNWRIGGGGRSCGSPQRRTAMQPKLPRQDRPGHRRHRLVRRPRRRRPAEARLARPRPGARPGRRPRQGRRAACRSTG